MINVFYAEYTLKQWNVNGFHKDAQGPWCQALLTPQYVPSTTETTWWESPGTVDILYTVSPPRWIEVDWKRISYLPFIEMNWTTAYKTLLLEWFCICFSPYWTFFVSRDINPCIGLLCDTYLPSLFSLHQINLLRFIFVFLLLKTWLGFHSLPKE